MTPGETPQPQTDPVGITSFFKEAPPLNDTPPLRDLAKNWNKAELESGIHKMLEKEMVKLTGEQKAEWGGV